MAKITKSKRTPIASDFGAYLNTIRTEKNITRKYLADQLNLAVNTVRNVEDGYNEAPTGERLKLWLGILGEGKRYKEAVALRASIKVRRRFDYKKRHLANEHIDRLLDAYENDKLTDVDLNLLRMIAPYQS